MKTNRFILPLLFAGLLVALGPGCKPGGGPGGGAGSKFAPVEKTSFNEVTSQLDPGGNFYMYLSTAQWLEGLSDRVAGWQSTFEAMPQVKDENRANIEKGFGVVTRLIKESGIEEASGVGISSVEIQQGLYRNKVLLYHYPGKGQGFFWNVLGRSPHSLDGLNLLPANTALAFFSDADLPLLWSVVTNETGQSGFRGAQDAVQAFPRQFEQKTQIKWNDFLGSLGGEMGLILTLNESNRVTLPVPSAPVEIPEPGLAIVLKVENDTIFNRIEQELKKNPAVFSSDKKGVKMLTMAIPLPLPIDLRPTAASSGGYLLIGTSDKLIDEIAAVQRGDKPGLKSTDEFKRLAYGIPDQGNSFSFVSERFGRGLRDLQMQAMKAAANKGGQSGAQSQFLQNVLSGHEAACSYSVGAHTDTGCVIVANGTQSGANLALVPAAALTGMMAAIAVPSFVKARATSQENACINNLRQIDAAKQQWALENHKDGSAVPTKEDLLPFLKKWPACPAGGTYTIGAVNESPSCSLANHRMR